jgi:hypothetical protein
MADQIVELQPDHVSKLCQVYNEGIVRVPHCYPVGEGRFKAALDPALGVARGSDRLDNERVFVAMGGSGPAASAHTADLKWKDGSVDGAIRFLIYPPGIERRVKHCWIVQ